MKGMAKRLLGRPLWVDAATTALQLIREVRRKNEQVKQISDLQGRINALQDQLLSLEAAVEQQARILRQLAQEVERMRRRWLIGMVLITFLLFLLAGLYFLGPQ